MNIIREIIRFYSKFTDYFFLTKNFHKYQIKYSNIYSNNYFLEKDQYSFVHIPKTAGTSVSKLIKNNHKVNQNENQIKTIIEYNYFDIKIYKWYIKNIKSLGL